MRRCVVIGVGNELRGRRRRRPGGRPPRTGADARASPPTARRRSSCASTRASRSALLDAWEGAGAAVARRRDPLGRARRGRSTASTLPPRRSRRRCDGSLLHPRDRGRRGDRAGAARSGACRAGSSSTASRARASTPAAGCRLRCSTRSIRSPDACWRRPSGWPPRPPARRRSRRRSAAGRAARGRSGRAP